VKKKLEIKKVTLRNLDSAELTNIAGGTVIVFNCASAETCPTSAESGCGTTLVSKVSCLRVCAVAE
jgi:hypothetical protein